MQAPRNWRMKVERYRLVGTENEEGNTSILNRPASLSKRSEEQTADQPELAKVNAA